MWWGFAIAGGISLINGLHVLFPIIPEIPTKTISIAPLFTEKPWNALLRGGSTIVIYPFAVGLFFLMPMELLASCLLFFFALLCSFAFLSAYQSEHAQDNFVGLLLIPAASGHLALPFTWQQTGHRGRNIQVFAAR